MTATPIRWLAHHWARLTDETYRDMTSNPDRRIPYLLTNRAHVHALPSRSHSTTGGTGTP